MTYYRIKPQYDNKRRYTWNNHGQGVENGILIGNELYTPREFGKLSICPEWVERVEIPKSKIYFFFGARFEMEVKQ